MTINGAIIITGSRDVDREAARTHARNTARAGIDSALAADNLDALNVRTQPQFLGSPIPVPNAGLCEGLRKKPHVYKGKAHLPHGRIF
jgi:hypothetical protein